MKDKKKKIVGPKKEVKRPASKKPRPKKYVEAKIPALPPVPTKTVEITNEASIKITNSPEVLPTPPSAESIAAQATWMESRTVELSYVGSQLNGSFSNMQEAPAATSPPTDELVEASFPDDKRLTELINIANKALEDVAKHAKQAADERKLFFDLEHLYEPCKPLQALNQKEKNTRWKIRNWYAGGKNKGANAPVSVNNEDADFYPALDVLNANEEYVHPKEVGIILEPVDAFDKKTIWSKIKTLIFKK